MLIIDLFFRKETVEFLLKHMFDNGIDESVIINGISVLLALLEIRRPAPFGYVFIIISNFQFEQTWSNICNSALWCFKSWVQIMWTCSLSCSWFIWMTREIPNRGLKMVYGTDVPQVNCEVTIQKHVLDRMIRLISSYCLQHIQSEIERMKCTSLDWICK